MLDINLLRTNPEVVRENMKKKFQEHKLPLVDEVIEMDKAYRAAIQQADSLRNQIKVISKEIGGLMGKAKKGDAEAAAAAEAAKEPAQFYKEGLMTREEWNALRHHDDNV